MCKIVLRANHAYQSGHRRPLDRRSPEAGSPPHQERCRDGSSGRIHPAPQTAGYSSALRHHRVRPQLRLQERTHQQARVNVLVDTSIWALALRRKAHHLNPAERAAVAELTNLITERRARIIGLVRQELLSGIKAASQYEKLRAVLRFFPGEPISTADYQ